MMIVVMMMMMLITISDHNHNQNLSLVPLSDFSLQIHSPPSAFSVYTLKSPTYTSSSPSPVPSCYCPADGCAAAAAVNVWSHSGKVEMLVHAVRIVVFLWFVGNHVTFGASNQILRDTEIGLFEKRTVTGTRGGIGSLVIKVVSSCRKELTSPYT